MSEQFRTLAQLRRPRYVLPLYVAMPQIYILGATVAYFSGIGVADTMGGADAAQNWLIPAALTAIYIAVLVHLYRNRAVDPFFACDFSGVYINVMKAKYMFIPWDRVRNIAMDASVRYHSPVIVLEARIEDDTLAPQLAAAYPVSEDAAKDEGAPWGQRNVRLAIPFRAVDPQSVLNKIYKMREGAGR